MGEEKLASLIGSPMCHTFCDLIMLMRDANRERVKYDNSAERCVKHTEKGDERDTEERRKVVLAC